MALNAWRILSITFVVPVDFALIDKLKFDRIYQTNLTTLDVGNNAISEIENLSHLTHLTELWVRIRTLRD